MKLKKVVSKVVTMVLCGCMMMSLLANTASAEDVHVHNHSESASVSTLSTDLAEANALTDGADSSDIESFVTIVSDEEATVESENDVAVAYDNSSVRDVSPVADSIEVANVRLWSFSNADAEAMKKYDAKYRIYSTGTPTTNNGYYASSTPDKCVDNNPSTHWETGRQFDSSNPPYLQFVFKETVSIGNIIYGTRKDGAAGKGFPHSFEIQASLSDNGNDFQTVVTGSYDTKTSEYIEIRFKEQEFKRLRFVFTNPAEGWASCREMMFYRSDPSDDIIDGLFTDYNRLTVNDDYNTEDKIEELREQVKDNPKYELSWKPILDRAIKVINKEIKYDPAFELSTDPKAAKTIERKGDVVSYARNVLRYNSFVTNRQVTGIAAYAGETVTIYVTGDKTDKLPRIRFSQAYGYWNSFMGGEIQLSLGVNTFVVPNFKNSNYKTRYVPAAGPLYIVNPYTEKEQSENVKVYIEGADTYPVFRLDDNEDEYKTELTAYADRVRADSDHVIDVTELVCDHAIMTVTATRADEIYDTKSPQKNLKNWDTVLHETLAFEGIKFDKNDKYYNEMNEYLNVNYRVNQVWDGGFMFAWTEMIGLYAGNSGENTLIYSLNNNGISEIGWGFIHEMGHTTDLPDRTIGETTNNMPANFVNTYYNKQIRNENYITIARNLASDRDWNNNGFNQDRYNYMVFFLLESYYQGYWGDTDNIYRYVDDRKTWADMTKTERYIYFASLASGVDLGYYFERWGFNMVTTDARFNRDTASDAYKNAIEKAYQEKLIVKNELPIWYVDSKEYTYIRDNKLIDNKESGIYYTENKKPKAPSVIKTSDGYSLTMEVVNEEKHLGYEIWEGTGDNKEIIGFTVGNAFTDKHAYKDGYTPTYSIVAYDRVLSHTAFSDDAVAENSYDVCEVNNVKYNTLSEGIAAANAGDTVYLLKDIMDSGIVVTKNITITPKNGDVTISRAGNASMFSLSGSVNLKLISETGKTLTLDGRNISQGYPLIYMTDSATLNMTGGVVKNNVSSNYAAIAGVSWYAYITVKGVTFENNSGVNGGAIYTHGLYPGIENCTFIGNKATYGAAVYNCGGYLTLNNITAKNNTAKYGGVLYSDGSTEVRGGTFTNNTATYGGAIAVCPAAYSDVRSVNVTNGAQFTNNTAEFGDLVYTNNSGRITLTRAVVDSANKTSDENDNAKSYVAYINSGRLIIDGSQSDLTGNVYLSNGRIVMQKQMIQNGVLTIELGNYSVTDPIVETNFALKSSDIEHIIMEDSDKYILSTGEDSIGYYLTMSHTVTLDPNGGTIINHNIVGYIEGETTILPTSADVKKEGYTFIGWYENGDFETNSVKSIKPTDTGDKKYTALWSAAYHSISFVTNGGTFKTTPISRYEYSETEKIKLPDSDAISRDGREFIGWYRTAQLDNSTDYPEPVTEFNASENRDVTFYAKWSCVPGEGIKENYIAPSCTEDGSYDIVVYCTDADCKKELSREHYTEKALGHTWGEWEETQMPDCDDSGVETRRCTACGLEETKNLNPTGHTPQTEFQVDTAPSCESDGSASIRCTICGVVMETKVLPKTGHTESPIVRENEIPVTCTQDGYYEERIYCTTCNAVLYQLSVSVPSTGHDFNDWEIIRSATCSAEGSRQRTCKVCSYTEFEDIEESAHQWEDEYTIDQAATCTTNGSKSIHCKVCNATMGSEVIEATGHIPGTAMIENEKAATCEADGSYIEAVYCEVCHTLISRTEVSVPAKGHNWSEWTEIDTPDCDDSGVKYRNCKTCGKEEYKNINATGHQWEADFTIDIEATCTTEGRKSIHCSVCDAKKDIQTIPASGHKAGEPVRENEHSPSCIAPGSYNLVTYCETCGVVIDRWPFTVDPLGHDFDDWVLIETTPCTSESAKMRVCKVCGYTETEGLDILAHQWMNTYTIDKEPTCEDEGSQSIHCKNCSAIKDSQTIPMKGHTGGEKVIENVVEPNCTTSGSYTESVYCVYCNALIIRNVVITEPRHSFGEWKTIVKPACETEGSESRTCSVCGYTETRIIDPTGHKWESSYTIDKKPTRTEKGRRSIHCKNCDAVKNIEIIPATGKKVVTVGNLRYVITSTAKKTVAVKGIVSAKRNKLKKVKIPATVKFADGAKYKVTAIQTKAFAKNKKLKTLVIGKNVKKIGKKAFYNAKKLKSIKIKSKVLKKVGKKAFKGINKKAVIRVPKKMIKKYTTLLKKCGLPSGVNVKK